ncbi:MAG: TatD family hydrolase, partial [Bacteroidales bacterium]|nr:TatD family hydrolase [Bacteroidales bacterium]
MNYIDTHTHIYKEYYPDNFDEVVGRAVAAGVTQMILPCVNKDSIPFINDAVHSYPNNFFPLIGLHPSDVNTDYKEQLMVMQENLSRADLIGVGEIGMDLYHDRDFIKEQMECFETQMGWAVERDFPVSIHVRCAYEEAFVVLKNFSRNPLRGVMHCFSGGIREAEKVIEMGFVLGIGGVVTFKNNKLQEVVKEIGLDHLVLETDAPFLAPTPHRGTPNESSYIPLIAEKLSDIFQVPVE